MPRPGELLPARLQVNGRSNPIGIGTNGVNFSWCYKGEAGIHRGLQQNSYRIIVASSKDELLHQRGDVWDSGRVKSETFWEIRYAGPPLLSRTQYFWQAESWDGSEKLGHWGSVASFTTGLLLADDWTAHWIGSPPERSSIGSPDEKQDESLPVFRHDFHLRSSVKSALLFISGLGQYEVHLNGEDVTHNVLNPGWTDYKKTVDYDSYDVSRQLQKGNNAFGVLLGNGMYNVVNTPGRYTKFTGTFGQPKFLLQLDVTYLDGTRERVISDRTWLEHSSPITFSSIYGGEDFDARILPTNWDRVDFQAKGWEAAEEVGGPGGKLVASESVPAGIAHRFVPIRTTHPKPGLTVYDFGQNVSGWPAIRIQGKAGSAIRMLPGELLNPDGTVSQKSTNSTPADPVLFTYTLRGGGSESWHPRFSYHSFRYVQVNLEPPPHREGMPTVLSIGSDFVHARVPVIGDFSSSNKLFNQIHHLIDRAVLSNLMSVVTDCPSREKLGWLEQTYLNASTLMLNYDVSGIYVKMARDMRDAQLPDGLVPSIAPEYAAFVDANGKSNAFRDSPEWGSAVILSPWALFQYTGNSAPLAQNYAAMQRYVSYLENRSKNGLLDYGLGDWYDIGPGPPGQSQLTSSYVTASGVLYEDLVTLAKIATLLGHANDSDEYNRLSRELRDHFNARLFNPVSGQYDRGSQTANALPLALGIVEPDNVESVLKHLVADIETHQYHVTAGDIGFHYVVRALTDYGRSDVLAKMLLRTDSPSYGYQLSQGATTLTEAWDTNPSSSQNHFMLGHGEEWFYRGLAGLSVDFSAPSSERIWFRPNLIDGVSWVRVNYETPMGLIAIRWRRSPKIVSIQVSVPPGVQAHLQLPAAQNWRESNEAISRSRGVLAIQEESNRTTLTIGSGEYEFVTENVNKEIRQ